MNTYFIVWHDDSELGELDGNYQLEIFEAETYDEAFEYAMDNKLGNADLFTIYLGTQV